ncbi:MAG TPA: hypothetical protein VNM34_04515 [Verrucomicrobiae bacterium]|nr:hypothetical protein [Verrucomicrobiae bacterium]
MIGPNTGSVNRGEPGVPWSVGSPALVRLAVGAVTRTEVRVGLVHLDGLRRRTGRRTFPDMFGRHRTDLDRDLVAIVDAFHDRLAGSLVTQRTDPPRVDPLNLRGRLATPASVGLRERLARPRLGTA